MEDLIAAAGALVASALTPGPNNLVVMRAAARNGLIGALPAIAGVVLGSLALLAVVAAGAGAAFEAEPRLEPALAVAGCLYLVFLGIRLLASGSGSNEEDGALPAGVAGLFGFQFLNPKSWVLVLTVTAAAPAGGGPLATFARLAVLFVVIPTACLLLWSAFGRAMARHLERRSLRVGLDRALGALLIASALLLLASAWPF